MSQARVTSVEALDAFRANLILFQSKARRCLDDAGDELRRTRMWLQHEQRMHWEGAVRKHRRDLEAAEQELFSAKLSSLRDNITFQQVAVRKAKATLAHGEEKLQATKGWNRNFDGIADPMAKRLEGLRQFLDFDLPKAITFLVQAARTLDDYSEMHAPPSSPSTASTPEVPPP